MAYLAECLAKVLKEKLKDLQEKEKGQVTPADDISDQDILCVQIAALCYNLGHGPFSHMFTKKFMPEVTLPTGEEWKFEVASVWMFLDIVENEKEKTEKGIEERKKPFDLEEDDLEFICELIHGEPEKKSSRKNKPFLYEILNNKWNGIDVRRWDYFARDCHHLGLSNSFDHQRLLKSARVCEVDGQKHICFKDTVADNVYDMFHTRYTLYRQSYQHKIGNIIEEKIAKALTTKVKIDFSKITAKCLQDDIIRKIKWITQDGAGQKESNHVDAGMKEFTKLTDHIFEEILYSTDEDLKDARKEIEDIVNRRLPKFVGEAKVPSNFEYEDKQKLKETLAENWRTAVNKFTERRKTVFLDADDFTIDVVRMDHGMRVGTEKGNSPFDKVYFYNKRNPDKAFKIKKYQVSGLMPDKFDEVWVRVYYNKKTDEEEEDAVKCFKQWCFNGLLTSPAIFLYEDQNYDGESQMIIRNCSSLEEEYNMSKVNSCDVIDGTWNLYDGVEYDGNHYTVVKGAYPNPEAWGANKHTVKSIEYVE